MLQERQEMLDTLQVQHNTLLSETAELKSQVETLQYNASLNQHGAAEGYDMPNNDKSKWCCVKTTFNSLNAYCHPLSY